MAQKLSDDEISLLFDVGRYMCDDMINCAAFADDANDFGLTDTRVNREVIDAWIAIAQEYDEAYRALAAGEVLLWQTTQSPKAS